MKGFSVKTGMMICGAAVFAVAIFAAGINFGKSQTETVSAIPTAVTTTAAELTTEAETTTALQEVSGVKITVQKGNTWKSGEKTCAQYEVKIENPEGGSLITDWQSVITFNTGFKVDQLWNGSYTVEGKSIKVTAAEYNKELAAGGELGFGFIGTFDTDPEEQPKIKLYSGGKEIEVADGNAVKTAANTGSSLANAVTSQPKAQSNPQKGTPVEVNGQLSVKGTQIVNKNGQPFIIKGISTHGIAWFPQYISLESFRTLRDSLGANTVRLALYSSQGEGYNTELHKKVDEGVQYASDLGMYVVIDWHILANGNPNTDKAAAEAFFKEMTAKYKDYNNVIYEICNEPNGDVQWDRDIKPYAQSMINTIRSVDNDAIIIVGTPTWSQDVDVAAKSPLTGSNIAYAFHFYAATHKAQFRDKVSAAVNTGLPVIVSEFGICDASGNGAIDEAEADKWMQFLDERNIGRICWNLSNKNESSAIIDPNCQKTSDWSDNELSQAGKWVKKTYNK